ncbi:MAG: tryptophan 2,3-dioxygenase family protein, partial [Candidatus Fonsibacter sp.]
MISNYLTYWDYVQVDTLLSLQQPRTDFPDESIFIMYHHITELYFKLCLSEFHQIGNNGKKIMPNGHDQGWNETIDGKFLTQRITRINRYFEALTKSFDIMVDGMER